LIAGQPAGHRTGCAGGKRPVVDIVVDLFGKQDRRPTWSGAEQRSHDGIPAHACKIDIDQQHVRFGASRFLHRLVAAGCLSDNQKPTGRFHGVAKPGPKERLMVDEQHAPCEHSVSTLPPSESDAGHARRRLLRA
jgi:hypothetical protein